MPLERECKLAIPAREVIAARLLALGAIGGPDTLERNWVFDTADGRLRAAGMLLRIRATDDGELPRLTVKKPSSASEFKAREEVEIAISSAADGCAALEALGFAPWWYYEKRRQNWRCGECRIALDLLPELGCFIEIEAETDVAIRDLLHRLGLDPGQHIAETYLGLFWQRLADRREPLRELRFT
ncbi:MAG: class IV adenylate cyclase [Planctomycetota bacterium]|nr:class IV adenylate cyclase [Planctomycetota bacterium]